MVAPVAPAIIVKFNHALSHGGASVNFSLDVDITLPGTGITAIFGPSGSGKTTLLRCIAGLEPCRHGECAVNGNYWQGGKFFTPVHQRSLGFVFQESSLFAHLTVEGNLQYAVKRCRGKVKVISYQQVLDVMALAELLARLPHQLSGGERQRVAIARALLAQPQLLLMDEPLASLDKVRKQEILPYLEDLRTRFEVPILYVSHSHEEVARLADHVVVLDRGRVVAEGGVADVFSRIDVALHLGEDVAVVLSGMIVERDTQWHLMRVRFNVGDLWLRDTGADVGGSLRVRVHARDVSLALSKHGDTSIVNRLPVTVSEIVADIDEAMVLVRLSSAGEHLMARITRRSADQLALSVGMTMWAQVKSAAILG